MEKAREELKKIKSKATKQRMALLTLLIESHKPLTIEEIFKNLDLKMDLSTIYRILDMFVKSNIVYQTDFQDNKSYFEYQSTHHHHIVCKSCGLIEDTKVCASSLLTKVSSQSKLFSSVNNHTLEFFGLCKKCALKTN
jgi:Fe2+ or Zn2+ uptake regulation protein